MRKLMLTTVAIGSVILISGQALAAPKTAFKAQTCPFQDTFFVNAANGRISSLRSDGNVSAQAYDPAAFVVGCADNNNSNNGNVYLTVANARGRCQLTISDGPFLMNPMVSSVSCSGAMQYNGLAHDFGTYQYTLLFS